MRRVLTVVLLLAFVAAATTFLWPSIQSALRVSRMLAEPAPTAGSLAHPLPGRPYIDTWGAARSEGRRHEGVDIFAARGTPVRATTRGVVIQVGTDRLGGRVVMVLGPGRYRHYYAHLDRYGDVSVGEFIERGTIVGYVGNTGNARTTPPHLHYGVYAPMQGAVNPYPLLRRE